MKNLRFDILLAGLLLWGAVPLMAHADVLMYHTNLSNDGQNLSETVLTPDNVASAAFGKLLTIPLDGPVVAQPLYKSGVNITTGDHQGTHNVVFVATEHDSLYALDAESGDVLWQVNLLHSFHGGKVSLRDNLHSTTDAPAIDPATNILYVESYEMENGNAIHLLSSIDITTGANYANPVNVAEGTNHSEYVSGPVAPSGRKFDSYDQHCRCFVLNPVNHVVYMAYGDFPDTGPYNGWVVGYSTKKDDSNNLGLAAVWCATPNGNEAGIWESNGGIAVDELGNLYVETGNGTFETTLAAPEYIHNKRLTSLTDDAHIEGGLQVPSKGDYGDSVVKLAPDSDTTQQADNPNGFGLHVADYFTPKDEEKINQSDTDLGSSSPVLLPDSVGSADHKQLLIANNKQGIIYLLDRNNMGGYHGDAQGKGNGTNTIVQQLDHATQGAFCAGAFYGTGGNSGTIYYTAGGPARAFSITNAQINSPPASTSKNGSGSLTPLITAKGATNAILWTLDRGSNRLNAYDASDLGKLLFSSDHGNNGLTGNVATFHTFMAANGHVYVGTSSSLNVYGIFPVKALP